MAKKKEEKQQKLEDILYECRNKLRGNASMTTKRDMLLTLVFLRFICSRFNEQREKIRASVLDGLGKTEEQLTEDDQSFIEMMLSNESSYQQDGVFYLQDEYNWDQLVLQPANSRALLLDNGIALLMHNEKNLKNALPSNLFVNARLEPSVLKGVMDDITKIDPRNFKDIDLIGRVYEYFLQQFAVNAEKEEGEFYTPQSIVELMANLIEPYDGTIYDPCCGSGGMFVQSVRLIEAHGGMRRNANVYGQESDPDTYRLAKMNLAARGISYHLGDSNASSFTNDKHPDLRADYIMANPPFNKKDWWTKDDVELRKDPRWRGYGVPPMSNANYAWILHMLYHLNQSKGVAGFLLGNGALEDEDTIEIRQKLIENDKVEAIIILPREMFYGTDTSVTLWILNQNKEGGLWHGRRLRNRMQEILFIDLRRWNQNTSTIKTDKSKKTFVVFTPEQIADVCKIYHGWQTAANGSEYDQAELYHSANRNEIIANNWSLTPSRYVKFHDAIPTIDKETSLSVLREKLDTIIEGEKKNIQVVSAVPDLKKVLKDTQFPLVRLGNYIEPIDERNDNLSINLSQGISNRKFFQDPVQVSENSKSDKIVRHGYFAYNKATTRNGDKISIAYREGPDCTVSSAYQVFRIIDENILNPYYLLMIFKRPEFDRYARFKSKGSAHEFFTFEEMQAVKIPLPNIEIQKDIVNVFLCAEEAKKIAEEAEKLTNDILPTLMQHIIIDSKK